MRAGIAIVVAVVAAAGCAQDPVLVCNDGAIPAVTVVVRDSVANAPIPQELEMVGILTDGSFTESMGRRGSELRGGYDRPGNYEVEIQAEGYQTWRRSDIVVEPGVVCRIDDPVELTARLVPETGLPAVSANPTAYMRSDQVERFGSRLGGPISRAGEQAPRPDLTSRPGSGAVSGRLGGISGNLRVAGSPRIDDLGFPRGRGRVPRGLAGGSAVVVTKREVVSFRPAVREALDQEPEKACPRRSGDRLLGRRAGASSRASPRPACPR